MNDHKESVNGTAIAVQGEIRSALPAERSSSALTTGAGEGVSIGALLQLAVEKGIAAAELKELVGLHERLADREAAREFNRALSAFQHECPPIKKNKTANIATKGGGKFSYTYAELDEIEAHIKPYLEKYEFSYSFDQSIDERGVMSTTTCTLLHVNGHSRSSKFTLPIANDSAASPQQKIGMADSYAKRRALAAVLGLNITEKEAPDEETDATPITEAQAEELFDLVQRAAKGRNDEKTFLQRVLDNYAIDSLDRLPRRRLAEVTARMDDIIAKKGGAR